MGNQVNDFKFLAASIDQKKLAETRWLNTIELDYLHRSARVSLLQHIKNEETRNRIKITTKINRIGLRTLKWVGFVVRMSADGRPKRLFQLVREGRRKRSRPRLLWSEGNRKAIERSHLDEDEKQDQEIRKRGLSRQYLAVFSFYVDPYSQFAYIETIFFKCHCTFLTSYTNGINLKNNTPTILAFILWNFQNIPVDLKKLYLILFYISGGNLIIS